MCVYRCIRSYCMNVHCMTAVLPHNVLSVSTNCRIAHMAAWWGILPCLGKAMSKAFILPVEQGLFYDNVYFRVQSVIYISAISSFVMHFACCATWGQCSFMYICNEAWCLQMFTTCNCIIFNQCLCLRVAMCWWCSDVGFVLNGFACAGNVSYELFVCVACDIRFVVFSVMHCIERSTCIWLKRITLHCTAVLTLA